MPVKSLCNSLLNIFRFNDKLVERVIQLQNSKACTRCTHSKFHQIKNVLNERNICFSSWSKSTAKPKGDNTDFARSKLCVSSNSVKKKKFNNDIDTAQVITIFRLNAKAKEVWTFRGMHEDSKASGFKKDEKENIYTVPNLLTGSRILLAPVLGYLVVEECFKAALGLFVLAGLTDLLDGFIARNFKNQMSAFGTALDPLADKILMMVLTVTLTTANLLPVPLTALIISRDMLLIATGFVIRYISLPPPKTLKRYFDITNPTAKLLPSVLSKLNTALQLSMVCLTLAAPVFGFINHPALQCLWYLTGATTASSGIDYVIKRKQSVKFLKNIDEKER